MALSAALEHHLSALHELRLCLQCLADLTSPDLLRADRPDPALDLVTRESLCALFSVLGRAHTAAYTNLEAALTAGSDV